jgi:hypothetical protein
MDDVIGETCTAGDLGERGRTGRDLREDEVQGAAHQNSLPTWKTATARTQAVAS